MPNRYDESSMKLNHLNLTVSDALEASQFLEKYFDMKPMEGVVPSKTFALVFDDDRFVLTLMRGKRDQPIVYPANFHIGFAQPSEERVNEINRRLKADGFDVPEPARLHGSWTFYFTAPGGYTIEVLG